jgi:hypothetical protein
MRLDYLCDLELAYTSLIVLSPFEGEDGVAYGEGQGEFRGERLSGRARWSNHPKRRSDGVYLPDAHGAIETEDGAPVIFHLRGRTRMESDVGLQNLVAIFESEDDRYAWLNGEVCVVEGVIVAKQGAMTGRVYVCVNELGGGGS